MYNNYEREEINVKEYLSIYYHRVFPVSTLFQWLSYIHEVTENKGVIINREISFIKEHKTFIRNKSFATLNDLKSEIYFLKPIQIDIGAQYNTEPRLHQTKIVMPIKKELVFDIDLSDYHYVRKCCKFNDICIKCWKFIQIAVDILETSLREDFDYHHILWVYSGRRGVHVWVCDEKARKLSDAARFSVSQYFDIIPSDGALKSHEDLYDRGQLHPFIRRTARIIDKYFIDVCILEQDILVNDKDLKLFTGLIPDKIFVSNLNKMVHLNTSLERWEYFLNKYNQYMERKKPVAANMLFLVEKIKIFYAYPRFDVFVTCQMKHLLKAPFSVHAKTGKISVPFEAKSVHKFNPSSIPTLTDLIEQMEKQFEIEKQKALSQEKSKDSTEVQNSESTEMIATSTEKNGDAVCDYTLLRGPIEYFKKFVSNLEKYKGCPPSKESTS